MIPATIPSVRARMITASIVSKGHERNEDAKSMCLQGVLGRSIALVVVPR
jgi:hypothetical protein